MQSLDVVNTSEAARELRVTPDRVRKLIAAQRLAARKLGRDWFINRADLAAVAERRPGRPRRTGPARAALVSLPAPRDADEGAS
ncbi:MAG TPA: helix-turn-helix domain-containing protein [Chloroflexota bacterium]|jgi:excisionase family DNA binding protein